MKLTLVSPPYTFWKPEAAFLSPLLGHEPPLGLLSLAAYARKHVANIEIEIIDGPARSLSVDETAVLVAQSKPDVVGITMATVVAGNAAAVAVKVKAALPGVKVVVGGPHVSGVGEEALAAAEAFDVGVVGEGEETLRELLEAFRVGESLDHVAGIVYRGRDNAVLRTRARKLIDDLDTLPRPTWNLLPGFPANYEPNVFFSPDGPAATLTTSRGCPFGCAFCDQSTFGRTYRAASPEYVYGAVSELQREYGIRYVVFCDDTFTLDRKRVMALCLLLDRLRPRMRWSCDANVMTVDREMLRAMRRAGCWSVAYGVESGSSEVLASLNKRISVERAAAAVRDAHAEGIKVKGLFMMGTPEESLQSIRDTRRFMKSLPFGTINLAKFTPYPGTALHAEVKDRIQGGFGDMNGMNFTLPSRYLSINALEREYAETINGFYSRPETIVGHLAIMLRRRENIMRLLAVLPGWVRARSWQWGSASTGKADGGRRG